MHLKQLLMAWDTVACEKVLANFAIVAVLLATLSYTGVLTPPKEYDSGCSSLCPESLYQIVMAQQLGQTCNYSQDGVPACADYQGSREESTQCRNHWFQDWYSYEVQALEISTSLSKWGSVYVVLNAAALFSSLATVMLCAVLPLFCTCLQQLVHVVFVSSFFLAISTVCAFAAFIAAHFILFFYSAGANYAMWIVLSLGCLVVLSCVFATLCIILESTPRAWMKKAFHTASVT